jgi:hypothetical protein
MTTWLRDVRLLPRSRPAGTWSTADPRERLVEEAFDEVTFVYLILLYVMPS